MHLLPEAKSRPALVEQYGEWFKWLALLVVGLGTIAAVLATTSFNVAVPALSDAFAIGQDKVQWVITGFMAALTVGMLPTPWFLERFGYRKVFLYANFFLAIFSIAGALSSDFVSVVIWRVLQGITAGLLTPLPMLAVMRLFTKGTQGRAAGILTFGIVLAPAVAPSLSGVMLEVYGWQSIFLLSVPFCIVTGVLGLFWLPIPSKVSNNNFDWIGIIILCLISLLTIIMITDMSDNGVLALSTVTLFLIIVSLIWLFMRHAHHSKVPIINLEIFQERSFAMGSIVSLAYGVGLYASTYLIPVYMQLALDYNAALAGFALLPSGIVLCLVIPIAGLLADYFNPRAITIIGMALFGLSFILFVIPAAEITYWELVFITIVGRIGLGLIIPALTLAMLGHVRNELLGQGSMIMNYSRQLGGTLGVAVVAVFVEWRIAHYHAQNTDTVQAYLDGFVLIAIIFTLATLVAFKMTPRASATTMDTIHHDQI